MKSLFAGAALAAILAASPALANNIGLIMWNSTNPGGAESATGTGSASIAISNLNGITISLSNVSSTVSPDQLTEGNISVTNTDATAQTLDIVAGGNGFIGPASQFTLTGNIGVTTGMADLAVQYFVDPSNTLNGLSTGPVVGTNINSFDTGPLTGPFSVSKNLTGVDSVGNPFAMAEAFELTLQPGASIFVQGASIEAVPGPVIGVPDLGTWAMVLTGFAWMGWLKRGRLTGKLSLWLASILALFGVSSAMAQTAPPIDDPLHLCYTSGCSPFNGVTIGPTGPAGLANWGFSSSPPDETGSSLTIAILVPDNDTEAVIPTITGQNSGVSLPFNGGLVDVASFNPGQDLTQVLGIPASPPNPYGAYSAATAALDPGFTSGVTGYQVLEVTVPVSFTTGIQGGQTPLLDNTFALSNGEFSPPGGPLEPGLPNGSIITGFLIGTPNGNLSTAQSSSLAVSDFSVVPGPTVGAGVPGIVAAALALFGFNRIRRARSQGINILAA